MNIFVLDDNTNEAAKLHCDKHVVKQIVEAAQCLSCAVIRHGAQPHQMPLTQSGTPYRGGYKHHPCSVWAGGNRSNFFWLGQLGVELCKEYTHRYNRVHACEEKIHMLNSLGYLIPEGKRSEFAIAISEDSICRQHVKNFDELSVVDKYRLYYCYDKSRFAKWTNREIPEWFKPKNIY